MRPPVDEEDVVPAFHVRGDIIGGIVQGVATPAKENRALFVPEVVILPRQRVAFAHDRNRTATFLVGPSPSHPFAVHLHDVGVFVPLPFVAGPHPRLKTAQDVLLHDPRHDNHHDGARKNQEKDGCDQYISPPCHRYCPFCSNERDMTLSTLSRSSSFRLEAFSLICASPD